MALNPDPVGTAIAALVKAAAPAAGTPITDADLTALWKKIMKAIYDDIKANAVVSATVAVTSVSGVTTGAGVSGPGAGTATGTIA